MRFLITAGPTREAIDPVRYLTNRSSGKMGYALAQAAAAHQHSVILISGPTQLPVPDCVDFVAVESAQEMFNAVKKWSADVDCAILCAAVADYRPAQVMPEKIKKTAEKLVLELEKTPDILGSMRHDFGFNGFLAGFAAETNSVLEYAQKKLVAKHCDLIVANDVSQPGIGFESQENEITLIFPEGAEPVPRAEKSELARLIIHRICERCRQMKSLCSDSN